MTPEEIAADRAVIDAATRRAGPWAALGTRLLEDTGGCTCGPGGLNGLHEPYCGAEPVAEGSPDVIAFLAAARPGWPRALDALEAAQEGNDRLGAMVEWLAEVIVDARDACQRAESIEPSGSPEWVESGIAMRTTVLREVRAILDRERNAHPFGLSTRSAVAGNGEFAERAEKAEAAIARRHQRLRQFDQRVRARHREVDVYDLCGHDDPTDCGMWETVDGEFVCGAPVDRVCDECRDKDGERIGYPCPTIRALDRVAPMRAWGIDPGEVE